MKRPAFRRLTCVLVASALAACNGGNTTPFSAGNTRIPDSGSGSTPITHIVLIIQENRTFNNLFATFPGATGTIVGMKKIGHGKNAKVEPINLTEVNLYDKLNLNHLYVSYKTAYDDGKMDAFNQIQFQVNHTGEGPRPYQYVNPSQVVPYWTMASTYALANAMFQTQGSGSFTAHQDLIRGGTKISPTGSLVDDPTSSAAWGCDAPYGTVTSLITPKRVVKHDAGPFPCTSDFPSSGSNYRTLQTLLDGKSPPVSWKYYVPQFAQFQPGALWNAFDVIASVRYGPEWGTNVSWPEKNIFNDISNGTLASMSWVIPDESNSDHPGYGSDTGPSWVASVVNAIGQSSYWKSTAIIVLWDDWGGFYDPVKPTPLNKQGGPGFRVPMIVVSPYARETSGKPGYISNTKYGFGSVVRFVEDTFKLGRLGTTDGLSNSMSNMFDFNQQPRSFQTIGSKYSRSYFLHQKPSGVPVDTE